MITWQIELAAGTTPRFAPFKVKNMNWRASGFDLRLYSPHTEWKCIPQCNVLNHLTVKNNSYFYMEYCRIFYYKNEIAAIAAPISLGVTIGKKRDYRNF